MRNHCRVVSSTLFTLHCRCKRWQGAALRQYKATKQSMATNGVEKGWGMDTKGRWVQMKGENQLKTPGVVGDAKKKVPEQKIYWTEGKRIRPDHVGHLPKGGWR